MIFSSHFAVEENCPNLVMVLLRNVDEVLFGMPARALKADLMISGELVIKSLTRMCRVLFQCTFHAVIRLLLNLDRKAVSSSFNGTKVTY